MSIVEQPTGIPLDQRLADGLHPHEHVRPPLEAFFDDLKSLRWDCRWRWHSSELRPIGFRHTLANSCRSAPKMVLCEPNFDPLVSRACTHWELPRIEPRSPTSNAELRMQETAGFDDFRECHRGRRIPTSQWGGGRDMVVQLKECMCPRWKKSPFLPKKNVYLEIPR